MLYEFYFCSTVLGDNPEAWEQRTVIEAENRDQAKIKFIEKLGIPYMSDSRLDYVDCTKVYNRTKIDNLDMTREEAKSCIGTIEMLQRLAYNIHGVMDVIDADNCKKIIKTLEQEPVLNEIRKIVNEWQLDSWTDNLSYECMIKIAKLVEPQER